MCLEDDATAALTGGMVSGNSASDTGDQGGGGVANVGGHATLTNCTVSNNSAPDTAGGGLYNHYELSLIDCTVCGHSAGIGGDVASSSSSTTKLMNTFDAAVFASPKTITLTSGPISLTDKAITTISGPGAGLLTVSGAGKSQVFDIVGGSATLSGLTVSGGNAQNRGGLENDNGTLTLSNVIVSGNTATGNGGGVYTASGGSTTLNGVTVSGNTAATGGGVAVFSGATGTLTNATIASNTATSSGGGLADSSGTLTMFNVTVSNNQGGGLAVSGSFANASLQNTIVAGNAGDNVSGGFADATNLINGNPLLAPLGNYGGQTPTMPLLPGSPALDAGSTGFGVPTIDQRGLPRPSSEPIDIGAFQSQGFNIVPIKGSTPQSAGVTDAFGNPLTVTVTAKNAVEPVNGGVVTFTLNSGTGASATLSAGTAVIASGQAAVTAKANSTPGSYTVSASAAGAGTASFALSNTEKSGLRITTLSDVVNPFDNLTSLREAVAYANAHPGPDTISFDPTALGKRPRTIRLIDGPLVLTDPATTTIIGPGARKLTIQGKGKSRVFDIDGGSLALSRVNIIGGHAGKGTAGALRNDGGTLRLKHVTIGGNRAFVDGGLFNEGRTTLSGVTIKNNRALIGGNVFNTTRATFHWQRTRAVHQGRGPVSSASQERTS
jgi:parallel beta-helix repeat protein